MEVWGVGISERISVAVMPGLVPGIHVSGPRSTDKTWMAGTTPAMTTSVWFAERESGATRVIARLDRAIQ